MSGKPVRHTIEQEEFDPNQRKTVVHSLDAIPTFRDECEEVEFWDTHELSDELWESLPSVPEGELPPVRARVSLGDPGDVVISVAIPKNQWQALRRRAKAREVTVSALIRGWVLDHLKQ
ncbi:MAG: CopG family antitoxin [Dehalococcoidia bacterium]